MAEAVNFEPRVDAQFSRYPAHRPEPESRRIEEAATTLIKAQKPVIVAGGGVTASQAQAEVVELAEILSIPVATSLNGKGTIPENHALSVGVVGSYSRRCANEIVSEADLVLFIGSHTGSQVTNEWRVPPAGTAIIQIDIDPRELGRNYPANLTILGDAKVSLKGLIAAVKSVKPLPQRKEWMKFVNQRVEAWRKSAAPGLASEGSPIRPERICKEIENVLPSDAILVADTGHAGIWTSTMIELKHPGQSYLRAAGSLGWALPAAMGAKCAAPGRPVVCFTGDGGFWYHLAELETAVRYGINTVTVVNNNRALNQVGRNYTGQQDAADLWQFSGVNLSEMARTMGCFSVQVNNPGDLRNALERALAADRPAVVEVISDVAAVPELPWHK
jgi:acetolactate synthase-1/2/3 large subunit